MDIEYLGDKDGNVKIIMTRKEARVIRTLVNDYLDLYFALRAEITGDEFECLREDLNEFIV